MHVLAPPRGLRTLVHGDTSATSGHKVEAQRFRKKLEGRFEIKTKAVGNEAEDTKEEGTINRGIRVGKDGWEHGPYQRHVELIINGLGHQEAKGVNTPCEDEEELLREENKEECFGK